MKKGIAIGESDFRNLIEKNDFYIDKTQWIEELIKVINITIKNQFY